MDVNAKLERRLHNWSRPIDERNIVVDAESEISRQLFIDIMAQAGLPSNVSGAMFDALISDIARERISEDTAVQSVMAYFRQALGPRFTGFWNSLSHRKDDPDE